LGAGSLAACSPEIRRLAARAAGGRPNRHRLARCSGRRWRRRWAAQRCSRWRDQRLARDALRLRIQCSAVLDDYGRRLLRTVDRLGPRIKADASSAVIAAFADLAGPVIKHHNNVFVVGDRGCQIVGGFRNIQLRPKPSRVEHPDAAIASAHSIIIRSRPLPASGDCQQHGQDEPPVKSAAHHNPLIALIFSRPPSTAKPSCPSTSASASRPKTS